MDAMAVLLILLVASSWLNMSLYTIELGLCLRYFSRPSRPRLHRIAVGVLVFADTVGTSFNNIDVCMVVVGTMPKNARLGLAPLATLIMATYISATIAQLFLCNLFHVLTGNKLVSGVLLLMIFFHLGFSYASAILCLTTGRVDGMAFSTTTVGAISCAATDIAIAGALSWKFWQLMAGTPHGNSTKSLLHRTLMLTVSSGAIVAGNTLLMMILLLKGSLAFTFFFACQGRAYSLTILGNFLIGTPSNRRGTDVTTPNIDLSTNFGNTSSQVFHIAAPARALSPARPLAHNTSRKATSDGTRSLPCTNVQAPSQHLEEFALESCHRKSDSQ
ncbi:hypothetical protein GGX14DRAFT_466605 [Mycena pura]|uniref:DUF6534 domain-containing protein n=1 Tax=Mycena pura TaxID=153505 RepID=A0AAD6V281_9AGAR|nr:hypothetical protein GGX14DRAFT_466605 [Mycena pura]